MLNCDTSTAWLTLDGALAAPGPNRIVRADLLLGEPFFEQRHGPLHEQGLASAPPPRTPSGTYKDPTTYENALTFLEPGDPFAEVIGAVTWYGAEAADVPTSPANDSELAIGGRDDLKRTNDSPISETARLESRANAGTEP